MAVVAQAQGRSRYEELLEEVRAFHRSHPEVWKLFVEFTMDRVQRGFSHYSVNAIFERIRWETDQSSISPEDGFKINNNYRAFYARSFMRAHPQYEGFFRTRVQTSAGKPATGLPALRPQDFDLRGGTTASTGSSEGA